jgi:hypothetical protein
VSEAELHVGEMCLILLTLRVISELLLEPLDGFDVAELELDAVDAALLVPVISTSWPTWSLSFEVSPLSWYFVPESEVKV